MTYTLSQFPVESSLINAYLGYILFQAHFTLHIPFHMNPWYLIILTSYVAHSKLSSLEELVGLKAKASTTDLLKLNLFIVSKSLSGYFSFEGDSKDPLTKIIQILKLQIEKIF